MNVVLPYFNAGFGHVSFAKALKAALLEQRPDWNIEILDAGVQFPGFGLQENFVDKWKQLLSMPQFLSNTILALEPLYGSISAKVPRNLARKARHAVARYIEERSIDLVIPTHWACSTLFDAGRRALPSGKKQPPIYYIYTELGGAYKLLNCGADQYFALTDRAFRDLVGVGIDPSTIAPIAPVVQGELLEQQPSPDRARHDLGLDPDAFTVLFSMGGEGLGSIHSYLKALYHDVHGGQVMVLTGKNAALKDQIAQRYPEKPGHMRIIPMGFLPSLGAAMAATDLLVGKCGTSFALESIGLRKPLIVTQLGAYNEKYNKDYIEQKGYGWFIPQAKKLGAFVSSLVSDPQSYQATLYAFAKRSLEAAEQGTGAQEFADYVLARHGESK